MKSFIILIAIIFCCAQAYTTKAQAGKALANTVKKYLGGTISKETEKTIIRQWSKLPKYERTRFHTYLTAEEQLAFKRLKSRNNSISRLGLIKKDQSNMLARFQKMSREEFLKQIRELEAKGCHVEKVCFSPKTKVANITYSCGQYFTVDVGSDGKVDLAFNHTDGSEMSINSEGTVSMSTEQKFSSPEKSKTHKLSH